MSSSMATTSLEQDVQGPLVSQAQGPSEAEAVLGTVEHRAQLCRTNQLTPNHPPVSLTQLNLELLFFISFYKGIFNTITSPSSICTHIQSTVTFKTSPETSLVLNTMQGLLVWGSHLLPWLVFSKPGGFVEKVLKPSQGWASSQESQALPLPHKSQMLGGT